MRIEDGFATEKRSASPTSSSSTQVQAKGTANSGLIAGGQGMMGSQTSQGNMSPPS